MNTAWICRLSGRLPRKLKEGKLISALIGLLIPVCLPCIHFGIVHRLVWPQLTPFRVDRKNCTCSCWDRMFKGSYEKRVGRYKNVYFNVTVSTLAIWTLTVVAVVAIYELTKHLLRLRAQNRLRPSACLLVAASIHPHYYSWWTFFNYLNDAFYKQMSRQTLFSVTELVSTLTLVTLCDSDTQLSAGRLLTVVTVSLFHVCAAARDQFVSNVLLSAGACHQQARDLALMSFDLVQLALASSWLLRRVTSSSSSGHHGLRLRRSDVSLAFVSFAVLWTLSLFVL